MRNLKTRFSLKSIYVFTFLVLGSCGLRSKMKIPDKSIYEPRKAEMRGQVYNRDVEFAKMDKNSDGVLSPSEFIGTDKLFADMDTDKDGKLSKTETVGMITFAPISTGTFMMGSAKPLRAFFEPAKDCTPLHEVKIDRFNMSATEVTNAQYVMFLNSALKTGEIDVREASVSNNQTRLHYPVPAYAVYGPKGGKYEGKPYIHLSPVDHYPTIKWITDYCSQSIR